MALLPLPPGATPVGMVGLVGIALAIVLLAGPRLSHQAKSTIGASGPRQNAAELGG